MEMKTDKPLILEAEKLRKGVVHFKVKHQSYTGSNFYNGQNWFKASNGIELYSTQYPRHSYLFPWMVFLQGETLDWNDSEVEMYLHDYLKVVEAVKEYNAQREVNE